MLIEASSLAALPGIRHAFFTRAGGVSGGIYASLNGGQGSGDNPDHVRKNRARMAAALGVRPDRFINRSEEHTSELQSQSNLVCRLLLEKKKKEKNIKRLQDRIREE